MMTFVLPPCKIRGYGKIAGATDASESERQQDRGVGMLHEGKV